MSRPAIVPLQLKHPEKAISNKLTWRQFFYLLPAVILSFVFFTLRTDIFFHHYFGKWTALFIRLGLALLMSAVVLGFASFLAFVPAWAVPGWLPWFEDPKPERSTDPYDVNLMIDAYLYRKFINKTKKKVLPWRGDY